MGDQDHDERPTGACDSPTLPDDLLTDFPEFGPHPIKGTFNAIVERFGSSTLVHENEPKTISARAAELQSVELERYVIALKRRDVCCQCGADLPSGFRAAWEPYARTVTCLDCAGPNVVVNVYMPAGPGPRPRRPR